MLRRSLTALAAASAIVGLGGCGVIAATAESYAVTPQGLELREDRVRRLLPQAGQDTLTLHLPTDITPRDSLLHLLYDGMWDFYGRRWEDAVAGMSGARDLAEDRFTKSVRENAAALMTNDRALAYTPGENERLFIHFYGAMALSEKGDRNEAAVEARRLSALLEKYEATATDRDKSSRAFLQFAAGAVFEAGGFDNDADVAYRNAQRIGGGDSSRLVRREVPRDSGDVIVFIEQGWVAHKVAQDLYIPVYEPERKAFGKDGNVGRQLGVAASLSGRVALVAATRPDQGIWFVDGRPMVVNSWGRFGAGQPITNLDDLLKISWPVLRATTQPIPLGVGVAAVRALPVLTGNVNEAAAADLARDRTPMLTRTIVRQVVKMVATEAAEEKATKKWGKTTGEFVGSLFGLAEVALERADTRAWQLLPAGISAVRLRLPAGRQAIDAVVGGSSRPLGIVNVVPGRLTVVSRRLWSQQLATTAARN